MRPVDPVDPVMQVLMRLSFRVRKAHPRDKRELGSKLLKQLIRQLDSRVARHGVATDQRPGE